MFRVILGPNNGYGDRNVVFHCPGCNKIKTISMVAGKIWNQAYACSTCGAEIPIIASLLNWKDVRIRYHNRTPGHECERITRHV